MHRTGEQFRLSHGEQTAVVVELGGALRRYAVGERQVVDGFGADDVITGGRGQLLLPWPNRIGDGRYRWQGQDEQLPVNETAYGNAIHGLLRWSSWRPALRADRSDSRVVLECALWPQPGYPFHLVAAVEYALGPGGLTVTVTARNEGGTAAPYGVGQHPYLAVGGGRVDDLLLTVPARSRLRTDDRALPVASEPVEGTAYDFRSPGPSGRCVWTPPSLTWSRTPTAGPWSGSPGRTTGTAPNCGSVRAPPACSSTPATPSRSRGGGGVWPWSR